MKSEVYGYDTVNGLINEVMQKVQNGIVAQIVSGTDPQIEFKLNKRNESMERSEKQKVKKLVIKEMQLLRLREPNMLKKEYQERMRKVEEAELDVVLDGSITKKRKEESPQDLLRKLLLENTSSVTPMQSADTSLMLYKGLPTPSRAQTQLFSRPAIKTVEHNSISKAQSRQRKAETKQHTYLTELFPNDLNEDDQILPPLESQRNKQLSPPLLALENTQEEKEQHKDFMKRMRRMKQLITHKKQKSIEKYQQAQQIEKLRQMEHEKLIREERERSLEAWREQVRQKIEDRKQQRYMSQEPLKSLYSKNPNIMVTEQIKKKQAPLYVLLNQQHEQQRMIEEKQYQEQLKKIREERKPVRLEDLRQHELTINQILAQRHEERRNQRIDAYLSHMTVVKSGAHQRNETEYSRRVKQQISMEKLAEESIKRETQKLYLKKINYGQKVMELYKPEINSQQLLQQREKVDDLRKKLKLHHGKMPSQSEYMDSRQQKLNISDANISKTKAAAIRSSMIQHQLSKESLHKLDRDNSLDSLLPYQRGSVNMTSLKDQNYFSSAQKPSLIDQTNEKRIPLISNRSAFLADNPKYLNNQSAQLTSMEGDQGQFNDPQGTYQKKQHSQINQNFEIDNIRAGNRQYGVPQSLPKNQNYTQDQQEEHRRDLQNLRSKISILQYSDVL